MNTHDELISKLEKSNDESIIILEHIIDTEQKMSENGQHLINEKIKELKNISYRYYNPHR